MRLSKAILASLVRLGFMLHGMVGLFGLVYTTQISTYWFIGVTMVLMMTEIVLTYRLSNNGEWKWFVPSAFIYLCSLIPVIWLLELAMLNFRVDLKSRLGIDQCPTDLASYFRDNNRNVTLKVSDNTTEFEQNLHDAREIYSTTLQQTMMFMLIVGRWLQPRGELTRDQLSQLLLVYIGMAADILEYSSETLRVEQIACDKPFFYVVITVWSWSLMQFCLGLTATAGRKTRASVDMDDKSQAPTPDEIYSPATSIDSLELKNAENIKIKLLSLGICGTELWALLISLLIQDGPYLGTRLYIIFHFHVYNRSMIFFTCKNALLLILMSYRLIVVMVVTRRKHQKKLRRVQGHDLPEGQDKQGPNHVEITSSGYKTRYRTYRIGKYAKRNSIHRPNIDDNVRGSTSKARRNSNHEENDIYRVDVDDDDYGYSDDDIEERKGAYIVAGNDDSIDLEDIGRSPTPPPFPSPMKGVSMRQYSPAKPPVPVRKDHVHFSSDLSEANDHQDFSSTAIYAAVRRQPKTKVARPKQTN